MKIFKICFKTTKTKKIYKKLGWCVVNSVYSSEPNTTDGDDEDDDLEMSSIR